MSDDVLWRVWLPSTLSAGLAWIAWMWALRALPPEDRRWHDPLPGWWRISWPLIRLIAWGLAFCLPARLRQQTARQLRDADLDRALNAEQWWGGCIVAAGTAALLAQGALSLYPHAMVERWTDAWLGWVVSGTIVGAVWPFWWRRTRCTARLQAIERALPFYLDVITLAIESGANLNGALTHAFNKGPGGPLQREIGRLLRDVRAGQSRTQALQSMADRLNLISVRSWVSAMMAAEKHGSRLGTVLRAQAEQRRHERFQLAEKRAMQAPVKMLFPLLVFIFPCTLALLFFPVVMRLIQEGVL